MEPERLLELWNRNRDRPMWVRNHRDAIHEHTDTSDPVPDGSAYQVREWVDRYASTVTRQLREAVGDDDPDA